MTLHLVQIYPDARSLARFAHRAGLPDNDPGYILHRALRDAFGGLAPQPFRAFDEASKPKNLLCDGSVDTPDRPMRLLGYCPVDAQGLRDALALAPPDLDRVFPSGSFDGKPMPLDFAAGRVLGFEVRICPIVRTKREAGEGAAKRELDAFVHATIDQPRERKLDREVIYRDWLAARLAAGGAEIVDTVMSSFSLSGLCRRSHASPTERTSTRDSRARQLSSVRPGFAALRPDATFRGRLRVGDPARFADLLATGVGRHRAFGFGMLLLRPGAG